MYQTEKGAFWVSRYDWEQEKARVSQSLVRVSNPGDSDFEAGQVVPKAKFDAEAKELKKTGERPPTSAAAQEPTGSIVHAWYVHLLPDMNYTVPIILIIGGLWLAWRVVNFPPFADFLIATEAELNKVSWTTQKRLVQDTIVVLVTVVLFTVFLLIVDMAWSWLLTTIKVMPEQPAATRVTDGDQPW
jgi:preprotein translocase SecE subunit